MKIAIIDIETTGLNPHIDAIVELGIVLTDTETFETEVLFNQIVKDSTFNPSIHSNAWIFGNSSLTINDVLNAPDLSDFTSELQDIFNRYPITAFNKSFDLKFLRARNFICDDATCLLKMSWEYSDKLDKGGKKKRPSMQEIYNTFFGDQYIEEHRALPDAIDEAKILLHIVKLKGNDGFIDIEDHTSNKKPATIEQIYEDYVINFGKHKGMKIADMTTEEEIQYCQWVLENHFDSPMSKQSNKYIIFTHHVKVCQELMGSIDPMNISESTGMPFVSTTVVFEEVSKPKSESDNYFDDLLNSVT
jgi:DNA polymerase III epsilon subunit-like protein